MPAHLLTLNAGSSSIKFALYEAAAPALRALAVGQVEGLAAEVRMQVRDGGGAALLERRFAAGEGPADHAGALRLVLDWLAEGAPEARIAAVGHRVVHGGPDYARPVLLDERVLADLERLNPLAPLHQPHNLAGVRAARAAFPAAPQVACFDTAFHRSHPFVADVFGLPRRFYEEGVRRYGFHGLSYEYIVRRLAAEAPALAAGRTIVAHLGNGASMCAVRAGSSIASTMGFSPLDGLPMGTRCGQLDPGVLLYLLQEKGMSAGAVADLLYRESGLKGLSGVSHDMRLLEAAEAPAAAEALDYYVFRVRREIGALAAALGGLDGIVFTGGVGENARNIRRRILEGMDWFGIALDRAANAANRPLISAAGSRVEVRVVRTDEEAMIAEHTAALALA